MLDLTFFVTSIMLLPMAYISAPALAHPSKLNFGGECSHREPALEYPRYYPPLFLAANHKHPPEECIGSRLLVPPATYHQPTAINHAHINPMLAESHELAVVSDESAVATVAPVAHSSDVDRLEVLFKQLLEQSKCMPTFLLYNPELNILEQV